MERARTGLIQEAYDGVKSGNFERAQVLALCAIADALMEVSRAIDSNDSADALKTVAAELGSISMALEREAD